MKLRTGRKLGRTLYIQLGAEPADEDPCIGMVDNVTLATDIVSAFNRDAELKGTLAKEWLKRVGLFSLASNEGTRPGAVPPETTGLEDALLHVQKVNRYHIAELHKLRNLVTVEALADSAHRIEPRILDTIDQILANVPKRGDR